jgi:hypothetical protein
LGAMRFPPEFCEAKAEECELHATVATDNDVRREWLQMADDWRLAVDEPCDGRGWIGDDGTVH